MYSGAYGTLGGSMDARQLALQKIALRCRTDLFFLCKEVLNYSKMEPHTHQELCDYTTSIIPGHDLPQSEDFDPTKNLLLLLMPRGTFKSSVVTIGFTLQFFLNEPDGRVLIDSETFGKAKAFFREIKWHLEQNEAYREVFKAIHGMYPVTKKSSMELWTDSELILPCRKSPKKEPSISCAGIDVTKNGMHYDLIICDDLHSENNTTGMNAIERIKDVIDHFKLAFSLLDPGKPMIVIGTRWHMADLYQHIIDFEQDDFNILVKSAYNPDGSLFFPEVLNEKELDKIKKRQGTSIFSKQYLNQVVSDEDATFKRENIIRKPWAEVKNIPINWYLSVDPSYEGEYSDFAALVLAGMDYRRNLYVKWVTRKKMSYSDIINEMFRIYTQTDVKIQRIILETVATQKSIGIELMAEQKRRNTFMPVTEIKSRSKAKVERIRGLAPFYEFNHAFHISECPNLLEFETELLTFPAGRHDDMIDAFATILEYASPPNARGYLASDDTERKHRTKFKPRSYITGV